MTDLLIFPCGIEMRSARILDVDISLISPNNKNRLIEESCPACVMRMVRDVKMRRCLKEKSYYL